MRPPLIDLQTTELQTSVSRTNRSLDMHSPSSDKHQARKLISVAMSICLYVLMLPIVSSTPRLTQAAGRSNGDRQEQAAPDIIVIPPGNAYRQKNFISDIPGLAP